MQQERRIAFEHIPLDMTDMHHRIPRSRGGTREVPNLIEKLRREHVAWHQIVRNMIAEEAVAFLSIMWQCYHLHNTGHFTTFRSGIEIPTSPIRVNPLSFPAQLKAFHYLFGALASSPEIMAKEIESWIDPGAQVCFLS